MRGRVVNSPSNRTRAICTLDTFDSQTFSTYTEKLVFMRSTWYIFLWPTTTLEPSGIETHSKSLGGRHTNTPQTPEEKAAELAAFDQKLYKVQLAMNESMSLVPWREDRAHIAPVTDIIDSICRAAPITPLDVH
ncbi:unnamed protein product [Aureobasidium pullulans]|nr:unnamed protein product [Aureobasidium pullulans]